MQQLQLSAPAAVPPAYGIQRAIELMRALPVEDDPVLVLRVVRKTLRSTGVSLEEIIGSARTREAAVVKGIESDRAAIEQLEIEIATRRANIARLESDLDETRGVRSRLEEAIEGETKIGSSLPPDEVVRVRAEALFEAEQERAGASGGPPPPPVPPPPPLPSASKAPPKVPSVSGVPGVHVRTPESKSIPASKAASAPPSAPLTPTSSIPDIGEIDDAFNEPTAKHDARAAAERAPKSDRGN